MIELARASSLHALDWVRGDIERTTSYHSENGTVLLKPRSLSTEKKNKKTALLVFWMRSRGSSEYKSHPVSYIFPALVISNSALLGACFLTPVLSSMCRTSYAVSLKSDASSTKCEGGASVMMMRGGDAESIGPEKCQTIRQSPEDHPWIRSLP